MMLFNRNAIHVINVNLKRHGISVTFRRPRLNTYGEPDGFYEIIAVGLFHEPGTRDKQAPGEPGTARTDRTAGLILRADAARVGDYVTIGCRQYVVSGVVDLQQEHLVYEVSLEEVDDGNV